jgi:uncharacterized membrane protein YfcA
MLAYSFLVLSCRDTGGINSLAGGGGLIGGYVGGMVSNRAPRRFLRALVIVIGFGVAAYYFWDVYGASITRIGGE